MQLPDFCSMASHPPALLLHPSTYVRLVSKGPRCLAPSHRQRSASHSHCITPVGCWSSLRFTYLSIRVCFMCADLHVSSTPRLKAPRKGPSFCTIAVCRSLYPVDVLLSSVRGRFRSFGVEAGSYPCCQHAISCGRPLESSWSFRSCYCSPYLHAAKVLTSLLTRNWCFLHCRLLLCSRRSLLARCKDVRRQVVTIVNTSTRP